MAKDISPRQLEFVKAYCSGKNAREAAIIAGYSPAAARTRGYDLLNQNEHVKNAVAEHKERLRCATGYDAEKAMKELDEGVVFAKATNNATALARFSELKMKMSGLLDKDRDSGGSSFQIVIAGLADPSPRKLG